MNSRQKNFTLWSRTKEIVDSISNYNITPAIKKDKEVHQFVLDETSHFPDDRKLSFRVRAVVDEKSCECLYCGNIVKYYEKKFCCSKCYNNYKKENPHQDTLDEILVRVPNLSSISESDIPNGTAEADDPEQFVSVWNQIKKFDDQFLHDHGLTGVSSQNIKNAILCYLVRIVTWNKEVTDYYDQVIKCINHPHKTENLEWYSLQYGEEKAREKMNIKSQRVQGENNPGYDHGGKFSPFSDKFVGGDVKQQTIDKAAATREASNGYTVRLSYWTERYGEEEGKRLFYERQNTFSLEKVKEKHGEEEGYRVWKERQDKWQNKIDALPEEEKIRINAKKGFWRYYQPTTDMMDAHSEFNKMDTIFYMIEYQPRDYDEIFIKIGVTSKYLTDRYPSKCIKKVLMKHHSDRFTNLQIERYVKSYIFENDLSILIESEDKKFDGWSECVGADQKDNIIEVANEAFREYKQEV